MVRHSIRWRFMVVLLVVLLGSYGNVVAIPDPDNVFLTQNHDAVIDYITAHTDDGHHANGADYALWRYYLNRPHPGVATLDLYFKQAAREFNVPPELLRAIALVETNWTHIGPSIDRGWGMMHLVDNGEANTLMLAAALVNLPPELLMDNVRDNIRGGAALLRHYGDITGADRRHIDTWFDAAALYSALITPELRDLQARTYFEAVRMGADNKPTLWGEHINFPGRPEIDETYTLAGVSKLSLTEDTIEPDYPPAILYLTEKNFYDDRIIDGEPVAIDTWVNHWIGVGTYAGAISWFHHPGSQVSAHFVIRASDGEVTQIVLVEDTAWHCGVVGIPDNNTRSIGVEHEVTVDDPSMWYSEPLLATSTDMARYLTDIHAITQAHVFPGIVGHNEMPGSAELTECPGPLPWDLWFELLNGGAGNDPLEIEIDIEPRGSGANPIDCTRLESVIEVAALTTPDFDALSIDHTTVTFEGAVDAQTNPKSGLARRREVDVDRDGDLDLLFKFILGETTLTCESTEGTLTGETYDGTTIEGSDNLRIVSP